MRQNEGKIIVHTGSMFSGKTSALLEDLRRFEIARYKVILFKPAIDKRYTEGKVSTHRKYGDSALQREAIRIEYIEEIFDYNVLDFDVFVENVILKRKIKKVGLFPTSISNIYKP